MEGTLERKTETGEGSVRDMTGDGGTGYGSGRGQKLEGVDQEMGEGWQDDEKWDGKWDVC
jgi:hypothetical protein